MNIKAKSECTIDQISLGEVMLRLDPGQGRIKSARSFDAWEGGGEYNVARGLRRCFGLNTAVVTALAENDIGRLLEDLILQGGVDTSFIQWKKYDGIGRTTRNGLNFTERGFGLRGAVGISDRGNTAASQLNSDSINWDSIFSLGVRWFHTGGIYAGLSETTPGVIEAAMISAKKFGTKISYDLNYRPSLWSAIGGQAKAQEVNKKLAPFVDVIIGNEEDFTESLGFKVEGLTSNFTEIDHGSYAKMVEEVVKSYPNLEVIATTLRKVHSASVNDWSAIVWGKEEGLLQSKRYERIEVLDRVGSGDSFASGLIFGLLDGRSLQESLALGVAHGGLAMTTPGDTTMASLAEVEKLARGGSARVER
ncbi:MAG: sugar kinase [Candidatus Planktophila sp.]